MNGIRYHRIQNGASQMTLADRVGVGYWTIRKYESPDYSGNGSTDVYVRIGDALGVTLDELLSDNYPEIPDPFAGHGMRRSSTAVSENPLTVYRNVYSLTFSELAVRLGNSTKESGRQACATSVPLEKHINALAAYEGITPEEFLTKYTLGEVRV